VASLVAYQVSANGYYIQSAHERYVDCSSRSSRIIVTEPLGTSSLFSFNGWRWVWHIVTESTNVDTATAKWLPHWIPSRSV